MVLLPSLLDGLARSVSMKKGKNSNQRDGGREAAESMAKDAKKNELMLSSSGTVKSNKSNNFASVCSKRGQKGTNQDCAIVWEVTGRNPPPPPPYISQASSPPPSGSANAT